MKQIGILWTLLATMLLYACGGSGAPIGSQPEQMAETHASSPRIALVVSAASHAQMAELEQGAHLAASQLGVDLWVRPTGQTRVSAQEIDLVADLIRDRVDGIILAPSDALDLLPILKQAQAVGIALVNIDRPLDMAAAQQMGLDPIPFIDLNSSQLAVTIPTLNQSRFPTDFQQSYLGVAYVVRLLVEAGTMQADLDRVSSIAYNTQQ